MAPLDLLSWPDLKDAEHRAQEARVAWQEAQRRFWMAPRGYREKRERALQTASQRALRADVELASLRRELGE